MVRLGLFFTLMVFFAVPVFAAPYAAMVMDMRTGKVLHSRNADTQLHPASLTKMMTLYVVFEAVENGEISLDTKVTISAKAANEPPSKLGLRQGQRIALRYLIRGAAVKSANDAATALAEAISGSEAAFARRMNRTAKAMGMTRTHFKNAHGLTEAGHMSTARDMTKLGRHIFFDYPQYYNLFSRRTADAGVARVANTNRRFLASYRGADGIKTGYTRAAGYNLVASAERGSKRIITTVFGGRSSASRNAKVAELMDMGFARAPTRVALRAPTRPAYQGKGSGTRIAQAPAAPSGNGGSGLTIRLTGAPAKSPRPAARPTVAAPDATLVAAITEGVDALVTQVTAETTAPAQAPAPVSRPETKPAEIILASVSTEEPEEVVQEIVTRMSSSGGRHWGINVGVFKSEFEASRMLLKTALAELTTLGEALRKVKRHSRGFDANFVGLTQEMAELACKRLAARNTECKVLRP
ncbi:MAG: D-alanyl-D-alanine carboxypeptidase [Rhodobacterales bacterium]|nr:MAG: D-alanyl-D-alanine carboxypeptidase [Rhodobacterales bacterium]